MTRTAMTPDGPGPRPTVTAPVGAAPMHGSGLSTVGSTWASQRCATFPTASGSQHMAKRVCPSCNGAGGRWQDVSYKETCSNCGGSGLSLWQTPSLASKRQRPLELAISKDPK